MLTEREQDTYKFIQDHYAAEDQMPTLSEIALGIGIQSKGVAHRYVQALQDKGYLARGGEQMWRGLQFSAPKSSLTKEIPLLGLIAAGQPLEALVDNETIRLEDFVAVDNCFALKVTGDSMIDDGILDGDVIICRSQEQARNNQIVVALIDNSIATLKRLRYGPNSSILLVPANKSYAVQTYSAERVKIQGILHSVLRHI